MMDDKHRLSIVSGYRGDMMLNLLAVDILVDMNMSNKAVMT